MAKAKIMIVEDDRIVAEDIQESLKKLGYAVSAIVSFGKEAIKRAKEDNPDLVLMDIVLSGEMNGTEAADLIRSQFNIPIVYLTAYADEQVMERAKITEPYGYIIKPFEDRELKIAIEIALYKHKMEKKLKESEAWFSTTLKSIGDAVISTDTKGYVTFMNPVAESLTGWSQDEAIKRPLNQVFDIINDMTRERCDNPVEKVIATGVVEGLANGTILISKDGKERVISDSGAPIFGSDKKIIGVILIFRDVTEKIKLQKQIIQSQKMEALGTLSGGIAHDFNNILSAIMGYTELTLDSVEQDSQLYTNLQEVFHAGNRAKDLVKQILTFSRQTEQELKPVQVDIIVNEALKLLRSSLPTTIEMRRNIQSKALIMADSTQIHQIIMNLCTNAEHAMRESGGVLKVELEDVELDEDFTASYPNMKPGAYINLTVGDTGHGMSPDVLERIFDPFFTTKETGDGTGMGLSVVHGIIGSYGGMITEYSEPGQGSTFKVYLPIIERNKEPCAESEESMPTGSECILFVDDEPTLANLGKQTLESLGYDVEIRTGSIEALELFKNQPDGFDLVIADMTMPNMTGEDLAQELMRIKPNIPIILCTGFSAKIDDQKANAMGIRAFVLKPIVKQAIATTVRKVLDEK
jgi:PAS domain S-box-containing protein